MPMPKQFSQVVVQENDHAWQGDDGVWHLKDATTYDVSEADLARILSSETSRHESIAHSPQDDLCTQTHRRTEKDRAAARPEN